LNKVLLEITDQVGLVTINRPEKRNALNQEVRLDLYEILRKVENDESVRAVVITGAGNAFAAGADLAAMQNYTPQDAFEASMQGSEIFSFLENMRAPTIAAVNGWALGGGCELALCCDLRIAGADALLGQPEIGVGIIPGYGALLRLPRFIGLGRAKELIYTGRLIFAEEAERMGLVNRVVPKEELLAEAMALASKMAKGPAAIYCAKRGINKIVDAKTEEALMLSSELYREVYQTEDSREGILSFLEKRPPSFKGK
jgi:enoyl-CoA hydratase